MEIKEFDDIVLKDGRTAGVVEVLDKTHFLVDVGGGPSDWQNIAVELQDVKRVYNRPSNPTHDGGFLYILKKVPHKKAITRLWQCKQKALSHL